MRPGGRRAKSIMPSSSTTGDPWPAREKRYNVPGCWQAFVEQGRTLEDRRRRLAMVPDGLQDQVALHLVTVFELKRKGKG